MTSLADALAEAGGVHAPRARVARLRALLDAELARGEGELARARSGYDAPVVVAFAPAPGALRAACPVGEALRADPRAAGDRAWLVATAAVGALVEATGARPPATAADLRLRAGSLAGRLVLELPAAPGEEPELAELAAVAFDDAVAGVDRLRARAHAMPAAVMEDAADLKPPIGPGHPLRIAEAVARLGGRPADPESVAAHDGALIALLEPGEERARPHADPDPARRVARRILQRLDGMGKWGGYHTEFRHLARGFRGNDCALALDVGERLIAAGLLVEKHSVGQRHVFLNPRRSGEIRTLIDRGEAPPGLDLDG